MGFLRISVGDRVFAGDCEAIITQVVSADQVIIREITTGAVQQVPIRNSSTRSAVTARVAERD